MCSARPASTSARSCWAKPGSRQNSTVGQEVWMQLGAEAYRLRLDSRCTLSSTSVATKSSPWALLEARKGSGYAGPLPPHRMLKELPAYDGKCCRVGTASGSSIQLTLPRLCRHRGARRWRNRRPNGSRHRGTVGERRRSPHDPLQRARSSVRGGIAHSCVPGLFAELLYNPWPWRKWAAILPRLSSHFEHRFQTLG